jgi:hypothetical protein
VYPTSLWDAGEIIRDKIELAIPAGLAAGRYQLLVGMYDQATGERLAIQGTAADAAPLTSFEIGEALP